MYEIGLSKRSSKKNLKQGWQVFAKNMTKNIFSTVYHVVQVSVLTASLTITMIMSASDLHKNTKSKEIRSISNLSCLK